MGYPEGSAGKEFTCSAGDTGDVGQSLVQEDPLEKGVHPLQYSCLENPTDRGGWWATVRGLQRVASMRHTGESGEEEEGNGGGLPAVSRPCFLPHDSAEEDGLIQRSPRREWGWRGGPGMPAGDWLWVDAPQIPVTPGGLSYLGPGAACLLPAAVLLPSTRDSGVSIASPSPCA